MRVLLFFGSFDPVHNGHIQLAKWAADNLPIDETWFVLTPQNPHKQGRILSDNGIRLNFLKLATDNCSKIKTCDIELSLPTPNYTINTMNKLVDLYPMNKFSILIGEDNAEKFDTWKSHEELLKSFTFYVYPRNGSTLTSSPNNMHLLKDAPKFDISSTSIRELIKKHQPISGLVPDNIEEPIVCLYRQTATTF